MPTYKNKAEDAHGLLRIVLALRLKQIEESYPNYADFVAKTGLSRGTLYALRQGDSNPTFQTVERLARFLGMSVFSLLGINEEVARSSILGHGFDYNGIKESVAEAQRGRRLLDKFLSAPKNPS